MSTPELYIRTGFILNNEGRITSTREPKPKSGPLFTLVRGVTSSVLAVRADLAIDLIDELNRLAHQEPPIADFRDMPVHADRYLSLIRHYIGSGHDGTAEIRQISGPAFTFPDELAPPTNVVLVEDELLLRHNFSGWTPGEIAAGRAPVMAILVDGYPVSFCCSARSSDEAAEAGLETAKAFRGRGFGPLVTAAWTLAIRATGRIPLYSTEWTNRASLSVARKLHLVPYASIWSLCD